MNSFFKRYPLTIIFTLFGLLYWLSLPRPIVVSGWTMGTQYTVKAFQRFPWFKTDLNVEIEQRLSDIVSTFSTYDSASMISEFNEHSYDDPFLVNDELLKLLFVSKDLYLKSNGLFDPTVSPLLRLWGYGVNSSIKSRPSTDDIQLTLSSIGFDKLKIEGTSIKKSVLNLELDFSSIAKGYAVDELAKVLEDHGLTSFYIEIGGDLRTHGTKPNGQSWRIGINRPSEASTLDDILFVLPLTNRSLATSGTYRQSQKTNKGYTSHIINPKTGDSYYGSIVSVSVIASTCMIADGVATFLLLMSVEDALNFVENDKDLEVLIIERDKNQFKTHFSSSFPKSISYNSPN